MPASLEGSKSFDFLRRDLRRAGSLDGGGGYDRSVYGGGAYNRSVYGGAYDRSVHAGGGGLGPAPSPGGGYGGGAGELCIHSLKRGGQGSMIGDERHSTAASDLAAWACTGAPSAASAAAPHAAAGRLFERVPGMRWSGSHGLRAAAGHGGGGPGHLPTLSSIGAG